MILPLFLSFLYKYNFYVVIALVSLLNLLGVPTDILLFSFFSSKETEIPTLEMMHGFSKIKALVQELEHAKGAQKVIGVK